MVQRMFAERVSSADSSYGARSLLEGDLTVVVASESDPEVCKGSYVNACSERSEQVRVLTGSSRGETVDRSADTA